MTSANIYCHLCATQYRVTLQGFRFVKRGFFQPIQLGSIYYPEETSNRYVNLPSVQELCLSIIPNIGRLMERNAMKTQLLPKLLRLTTEAGVLAVCSFFTFVIFRKSLLFIHFF